ncbi:MAG: 5'-methylthioadenosine/S-adenosylhomocysteine nucleosidase [Acidobacteria bacterium]|nr:5'-methylthioadenosine/S-adenosylhomocysteine nucleosidase [Acidobacteriota bacterium]MBI3473919.1 5'-methylthioadenosine/S-adenosylhomocysteine nucleosidase [Candidatus Solibacter usitatus]
MKKFAILALLVCSVVQGQGQKYDLLVQGAENSELRPLLAALEGRKRVSLAAWSYWAGTIGKKSVVISRTDIGPLNAAASTVLGIQRFRPGAILNQGTAGAHNPDLNVFDIVVGERTVDYGPVKSMPAPLGAGVDLKRWTRMRHKLRMDGRQLTEFDSFTGDAALMAAALAVPYSRGKVLKGTIGTAHQFNRELDKIVWTRQTFGTDTEDMESAYVAGVAAAMKVPFLAIRIVSDSEYNHPAFERIAGEYCAEFVVEMIKRMK